MKVKLVLIAVLLGSSAFAGDKVGHGGGLWGCMTPAHQIDHGMLIDLYEAKEEYGLTPIASSLAPLQIVDEREQFLKSNLSEYAQILNPFLAEVKSKLTYVDAVVRPVDDSLYHIIPLPKYCPQGQWDYIQFANFTDQGLVLVQRDLWESTHLPNLDKSALIWHEAIYRWLRVMKGDVNSIRARRIVGIFYSTLSGPQMRVKITEVLQEGAPTPVPPPPPPTRSWFCMLTDPSTGLLFSAIDADKRAAELATLNKCQDHSPIPCNEYWVHCDQFDENPSHVCELKNLSTGRIYSAKGRSTLEATYNVVQACVAGPNSYGQCVVARAACR